MEDSDFRPVAGFKCGDKAIFACSFKKDTATSLRNVRFRLAIDSPSGNRIAILDNDLLDCIFDEIREDHTAFLIYVDRMPLAPGKYGFTLVCFVGGAMADWIQNAGFFEVLPGDFWGTGRLPPREQGYFLLAHSFGLR
jgi:lipopolysaccharide transport system ATP-binding protein